MTRRMVAGLVTAGLAVALAAAAPGAFADTITLKNGRELNGRLVEEKKDYILIKVAATGGTMRIPKRDIATFTEDDNFGQALIGKPRSATAEPQTEEKPGGKPEKKDPRDLSDDERQAIQKLKEKLQADLKKVGAAPEERRKAAELSPEEAEFVKARITIIQSNKGSRNWQRQETVRDLLGLGPKGVRPLVGLLSEKAAVKAIAADGLAQLGGKPDEKWAAYDANAPAKLLGVLEEQGDELAGRARERANAALEVLTGRSVGWQPTEEAFRSAAEAEAAGKWRPIVTEAVGTWKQEEEKNSGKRQKVLERLKLLDGPDWRDAFAEDEETK